MLDVSSGVYIKDNMVAKPSCSNNLVETSPGLYCLGLRSWSLLFMFTS